MGIGFFCGNSSGFMDYDREYFTLNEWVELKARWDSQCSVCESTISLGSTIMWKRGEKAIHKHCFAGEKPKKGWKKVKCSNCGKMVYYGKKSKIEPLCDDCKKEHYSEMDDK